MEKTKGKVTYVLPTDQSVLAVEKNASGKWRVHDGQEAFRLMFVREKDAYDYAQKHGYPCIGLAEWNEDQQRNEYTNVRVVHPYL